MVLRAEPMAGCWLRQPHALLALSAVKLPAGLSGVSHKPHCAAGTAPADTWSLHGSALYQHCLFPLKTQKALTWNHLKWNAGKPLRRKPVKDRNITFITFNAELRACKLARAKGRSSDTQLVMMQTAADPQRHFIALYPGSLHHLPPPKHRHKTSQLSAETFLLFLVLSSRLWESPTCYWVVGIICCGFLNAPNSFKLYSTVLFSQVCY